MYSKYIKWGTTLIVLVILLLIAIYVSVSIGVVNFSISDLIAILRDSSKVEYSILTNIRIPRTLVGLGAGGALSISGLSLQAIYRNPLVEPYTLGISGGAALGVAIAISFGLQSAFSIYTLPLFGAIGAFGVIFLIFFLGLRKKVVNVNNLLLIGVMISFVTSSALMMLMTTTTSENLQSIVFWTMGSLEESNRFLIYFTVISSILGLIGLYFMVNQLNAFRIGQTGARHLGINTDRTAKIVFVLASVLTGISVSVAGIIGFVGLVIPHIMRYLIGNDYRILIISSYLGGAIFLIVSDLVARTIIAPNELPVGVITGIIGGSVFVFILSFRGKYKF